MGHGPRQDLLLGKLWSCSTPEPHQARGPEGMDGCIQACKEANPIRCPEEQFGGRRNGDTVGYYILHTAYQTRRTKSADDTVEAGKERFRDCGFAVLHQFSHHPHRLMRPKRGAS